jgi:hypothetical protein
MRLGVVTSPPQNYSREDWLMANKTEIKGKLSDAAIITLIAWLDASDRNAKDTDEDWPKGFMEVQKLQEKLRTYFTKQEITGFILNMDKLRDIINQYAE